MGNGDITHYIPQGVAREHLLDVDHLGHTRIAEVSHHIVCDYIAYALYHLGHTRIAWILSPSTVGGMRGCERLCECTHRNQMRDYSYRATRGCERSQGKVEGGGCLQGVQPWCRLRLVEEAMIAEAV